jgi:transcriptional regulator with XRE-family HTH domain
MPIRYDDECRSLREENAVEKGQQESPLGTVLQQMIRESGLSMNQLGKEAGVSQGQLSRFVRGDRTLTLPAVDKLCRFFGLKLVPAARKLNRGRVPKPKGA